MVIFQTLLSKFYQRSVSSINPTPTPLRIPARVGSSWTPEPVEERYLLKQSSKERGADVCFYAFILFHEPIPTAPADTQSVMTQHAVSTR